MKRRAAPGRRLTLRCEAFGEQTGLDALVGPRRKRCRLGGCALEAWASGANALSRPPGEYGHTG